MTYFAFIDAEIVLRPKIKSSRAQVGMDKPRLCNICEVGHCDLIMTKCFQHLN